MAGLLYKKGLIILCAMVFLCHSAYSYESSFPFPFEFGHSSDIYFKPKKAESQKIKETQEAINEIKNRNISTDSSSIIKYIKKDDAETINLLLKGGMRPNEYINASAPVYYAVKYKSNNVLKVLLDNGADPNGDLNPVLGEAIKRNNFEAANILIQSGADLNASCGIFDESILYIALKNKEYGLARTIIEKGAKIDSQSYKYIKSKNLERKIGITLNK